MKTSVSPQKNRTLKAFIIALGVYSIAIFSFLHINTKLPQDVGVPPHSIAITITKFATQEPPKQEMQPIQEMQKTNYKKKEKLKQKHKKETQKLPQIQNIDKTNSYSKTTANNSTQQAIQETQTLVFGKTNDPFLISIKHAIDKNLHYPRKARIMRLSGVVNIKFELLKDGRIKNIKIIDSSGHGILDKSAHKTILDATAHFPLPKNNVIIQIPIHYKLI